MSGQRSEEGEDWHIAKGMTVMLAGDDAEAPNGVSFELHLVGACARPETRADMLLEAFRVRALTEPQWAGDLLAWWLDRSAP